MDPEKYTIQALVTGLGWITFAITRDRWEAERLEARAVHADPARWPGSVPRRTRILVNDQPPAATPKFESLESWA